MFNLIITNNGSTYTDFFFCVKVHVYFIGKMQQVLLDAEGG